MKDASINSRRREALKRAYAAPILTHYGNIVNITASVGTNMMANNDGVSCAVAPGMICKTA